MIGMQRDPDTRYDQDQTNTQRSNRLKLAIPVRIRPRRFPPTDLPARERDEIRTHIAETVSCLGNKGRAVHCVPGDALECRQEDV